MALKVRHLNADSSFLLTFSPASLPITSHTNSPTTSPVNNNDNDIDGSFSILLDPWLVGPSTIFCSKFAIAHHTTEPCVSSLDQLARPPDLILISQDKSDHCHEATLRTLPPHFRTSVLGTPAAAKRIKSWKHFDASTVHALKRFDQRRPDSSVHRIEIPAASPSGTPGEATVALLTSKWDLTGLHNALAITYRPPSSDDAVKNNNNNNAMEEKVLSVIYSPHGADYDAVVKPYAETHLSRRRALPLDLLVHSIDRATNPWYFGGNITSGSPGGIRIAHELRARAWIGAHDEEKECAGLSVRSLTIRKFGLDGVRKDLVKLKVPYAATITNPTDKSLSLSSSVDSDEDEEEEQAARPFNSNRNEAKAALVITDVVNLRVGQQYILSSKTPPIL